MVKKVLLVNADYPKSHYDFLSLHTGLGYISEFLEKSGIEYEIYNPALDGGYRALRKKILHFGPHLIGYSMMSLSYSHNYEIISKIKYEFPSIMIVAGGPHISTFKKDALMNCEAIDIGVMMEGEETLVEIARGKPLDEIAGIIYRDEKRKIIEAEPRALIEDLDRISFPKYRKFGIHNYPKIIPIVTSRGCPYQCIFCPIASVMGARFRARGAPNVVDEIEFWHNKGFKDFSIADDVFNFKKERVYSICDEIEKRRLSGLRIRCSNGIRADRVDTRLLKRMKEVGFYYLAFGVESASNKVLQTLKKGERMERIEESVREACRLGFGVELFFLIGSPGETWTDVQESIRFALRYPIHKAQFYNLIPFPNTELYRWLEEKDYFLVPHPEHLNEIMHHVNRPIFTTPEMPLRERKKAFRYADKIIRQHTKKRGSKFEKWLTKEKLRDYYGIKGISAGLIAWFYNWKWSARLVKLLAP